jgi:hypothetical protein
MPEPGAIDLKTLRATLNQGFEWLARGEIQKAADCCQKALQLKGKRFVLNPISTSSYYVELQSGVCINPQRKEITATVNTFAPFDQLSGDTVCANNPAELTSSVAFGTVQWFENMTDLNPLFTGLNYTTDPLTLGKVYFVRATNKRCQGPKLLVTVLDNNPPFPDFTYSDLSNQRVEVSPANAINASIFWDFGDGFTSNQTTETHRYADPGKYKIKLQVTGLYNGCIDSSSVIVDIAYAGISDNSVYRLIEAYPNPVSEFLNLEFVSVVSARETVKIFDMSGKEHERYGYDIQSGTNKLNVDCGRLESGMYILAVGSAHLTFIKL